MVDLRVAHIRPLIGALGDDFEVDEASLEEEVRRRGSWNIFFLPLAMKVDLFIKRAAPFDESEFARRRVFDLQVLRMSGAALDDGYLATWSATLGLSDLLARAQAEAARLR